MKPYDYLQISIPKMLWKVVANKLCVVVCKPNGVDDIICICQLDDEPQYTIRISKAQGTFSLCTNLLLIPFSILVGVDHLAFNLVVEQYYYCFYFIIQCYKCGITLGLGNNCFNQSSIYEEDFGMGFVLL